MKITKEARLRRSLIILEKEAGYEREALERMDGILLREVTILRNKKQMHLAEIDQMIRNTRDELARLNEAEAVLHGAV